MISAVSRIAGVRITSMEFAVGDRVKLSGKWLARTTRLKSSNSLNRPDRRGAVAQISKSGSAVYVLWDHRRTTEALHGAFLEHADGASETPGVPLSISLST
jgi:hypothetical protein